MFSRMGSAAFKKDLTNTKLLCEKLNHPQKKFKAIHVGGTNGKGSVSHMLAAILQKAGYKTGLYTSPHLYDFRERIKVDGSMIDQAFVIDFVDNIKPLIEEIEPSFFEITVAMAFSYFAHQQVDVAVIEVGLGGRLDSTNIITPVISIITNIGWDHMNMLGNTLPDIAFEKAGIIKNKVPVVSGERSPETSSVFLQAAKANDSAIYFAEDQFSIDHFSLAQQHLLVEVKDLKHQNSRQYHISLPGIYQTKNIVTVLQSVRLLQGKFHISEEDIAAGIKEVKTLTGLYGRWELIHTDPMIVLEVAHNKNGIEQMLRHISGINHRQLHLVFGMVKDKDIDAVLSLLPKNAFYYFTKAHLPRALPAEELQKTAGLYNLSGEVYSDVNAALMQATHLANKNDLIIVFGSIFLVAEVDKTHYHNIPNL